MPGFSNPKAMLTMVKFARGQVGQVGQRSAGEAALSYRGECGGSLP